MFLKLILFALVAVALAVPQEAVLRSSESQLNADGSYKFRQVELFSAISISYFCATQGNKKKNYDQYALFDECISIFNCETASRLMMAHEWLKVVSRSKLLPKTSELLPEDNTHMFTKVYDTPSIGLPMKMDMLPPVITCPKLLKLSITSWNRFYSLAFNHSCYSNLIKKQH